MGKMILGVSFSHPTTMIQAMSCYFDSKAVLRESICYIQGVTPKKQIAGVI
jgi:hypothetical protein